MGNYSRYSFLLNVSWFSRANARRKTSFKSYILAGESVPGDDTSGVGSGAETGTGLVSELVASHIFCKDSRDSHSVSDIWIEWVRKE